MKVYSLLLFLVFGIPVFLVNSLHAQTPPVNFTFSNTPATNSNYVTTGYGTNYSTGTNYNLYFGYSSSGNPSDDRILTTFEIGATTYTPITLPNGECYSKVVVNRVANPDVSDMDKQTLFYEYGSVSGTNVYMTPTYANIIEAVNSRIVNRGGDNVFSNTDGQTLNNIERIDLIIGGGVFTPDNTQSGFLVLERGGNDEFIVAAITSLDINGNVSGIGSLVHVNDNTHWGNTSESVTTTVFQRGSADAYMRPNQNLSAQNIEGVFVTFSDLGVSNNSLIYGLAIFPGDVVATMDLINLTDVPLNTTAASNDAGGLDLMGGGGYFASSEVIVTDLQTTITSNTEVPSEGDTVQITVRADNNGPLTDSNITVTIHIPTGYTFQSVNAGYTGNYSQSGNTITWTFSYLNYNQHYNLTFKVVALATGGRIFDSNIDGDLTDVAPGNNYDELELTLDSEQSPLPVELIDFTGISNDEIIELNWSTASEFNNKSFEIERSKDLRNFITIGTVNGRGLSNSVQQYSFLDQEASGNLIYYRLKQVDFDGAFSYSKTIVISRNATAKIEYFPNPFNSQLVINNVTEGAEIKLFSIDGKLVRNKISDGKHDLIDAADLLPGMYFIEVMEGSIPVRIKVIKH
jgi:uncharacterized repeat protein (TIGR01451 family)